MQEHGAGTPVDAPRVAAGRRAVPLIVAACLAFALDQLTKSWAVSALDDRDIDLVGSLRFHLERNSGSAFSLNQGRGGLIAILALGVVLLLIWMGRSIETRLGAISLGLVLGGALGNLADRFFRGGSGFAGGAVVDFIDVQWWPVFNVADIVVTVGGVLLVLTSTREP